MFGKSGAAGIVDIRGAVLSAGTVDDTPTEQEGSASFFEKNKQKTFATGGFCPAGAKTPEKGLFLLLFCKKRSAFYFQMEFRAQVTCVRAGCVW
jgi:hypothetical protein